MRHRRLGSALPGAVLLVVLAALLWLPGVAQAQWWQTYMATPGDSFSRCELGVDAVVFLAGSTGGAATRSCSIPAGRSLLVPLINTECSTLESNGTTPAQLRACARAFADQLTGLVLTIDALAVPDLQQFRVASPVVSFTAVPGNVFGVQSGTTPSVAPGARAGSSTSSARWSSGASGPFRKYPCGESSRRRCPDPDCCVYGWSRPERG